MEALNPKVLLAIKKLFNQTIRGKNWAMPYIKYAKAEGLFDGLGDIDVTKASIRKDIFEIIYNALPILENRNTLHDQIALKEKTSEKAGDIKPLVILSPNTEKKTNPDDKYVYIPDPLFLKVINKNLDSSRADDQKVTKEEMASLTTISHWLDADGKPGIKEDAKTSILGTPKSLEGTPDYKFMVSYGIKSIEGIQYAKNLKQLKLNENEIADISPLKNLTSLEYLEFSRNRVVDVSPLKNLTHLTFLKLYNNWIEDITPLAGLVNLTDLDLHNNVRQEMIEGKRTNSGGISDISALKNMTKLKFLDVSANNLKDVAVINNFPLLKDLDLSGNHIETYVGLGDNIANRYGQVEKGIGSQNFWAQWVIMKDPINVDGNTVTFDNQYKGFDELFTSLAKNMSEEELSNENALSLAQMATFVSTKESGVEVEYNLVDNQIQLQFSDDFLAKNKGTEVNVNVSIAFACAYAWTLSVPLVIQ